VSTAWPLTVALPRPTWLPRAAWFPRAAWLPLAAWLSVFASLSGCAAARDVLTPYAPRGDEVRQTLALPMPAATVDVAIVLGCPAAPDGSASPCEKCRVKTAVRRYQAGDARYLLFTGGAAHSPDVEAEVMGDLAVARGVPAERVLREGRALTTWQNIRYSARLMRDRRWSTVLFISTAGHVPRARRVAQFYGIDDAHAAYAACDLDLPLEPGEAAEDVWPPPPSDLVLPAKSALPARSP